ncbi:isocitrate/isopropylmalate family dehydrogenase [Actinophytocola sp.]|uniref:isocitrate/isopropylmalate family dehydrogenase n=1 Tax=Actinophytocola sp. TaxID=1872138 RepID=UPI003D6AFAFA
MGAVPVALLPGDGIGPEIVEATTAVLDAAGAEVEWLPVVAGARVFEETGEALPAETVETARAAGVVLKGPMGTPRQGYRSPNQRLRDAMGTFANVRLARSFPHPATQFPGVDLTLIRDVTEDFTQGTAQRLAGPVGAELAGVALRVTTRPAVDRLARFAYDWARARGKHRVAIGHLATSQRATDGLFVETALAAAADGFTDLDVTDEAMDPLCTHLMQHPGRYDVLLTGHLYGGILCGVLAGLIGTVGLLAGAAFGTAGAIFEAGHGNVPKYAGLDRANPAACILSGAIMLDHLGQTEAAKRVRVAVERTIAEGRHTTPDLGGTGGTRSFARRCRDLAAG